MKGHNSIRRVVAILVIAPLLVLGYYASWWVLPMWRWINVDFAAIAKQSGIPEAELRKEFKMVVHYNPRPGITDPCPFQIVESDPTWASVDPANLNEDTPPLLVRCTLVSERDGESINKLWISVASEENFFRITAWRFPGGTFGKNAKRPVVVFRGLAESQNISTFGVIEKGKIASWQDDDNDFPQRRDEFSK